MCRRIARWTSCIVHAQVGLVTQIDTCNAIYETFRSNGQKCKDTSNFQAFYRSDSNYHRIVYFYLFMLTGWMFHFPAHFHEIQCQPFLANVNSRTHTGFRLVPTSMTLNDLERRNSLYFAFLANVNSRSRSLYVVARLFVCRL